MKILEKIAKKNADIYSSVRVPTIAFFGDSVTHGCFELYQTGENTLETVFDQRSAYHTYLKNILSDIFPKCPLNVLNAGISGDNATNAVQRLQRDVLSFSPDLVVICFGLNDCTSGMEGIESYRTNLTKIVRCCKEAGAEVILMTPNDMADRIHPRVTYEAQPFVKQATEGAVNVRKAGFLDKYVDVMRSVAKEQEVSVCDVYAKWKALQSYGADTTEMLANYVNHPARELNKLFAYSLLDTMMEV